MRSAIRVFRKQNAIGISIQKEICGWRRHVDKKIQEEIELWILGELANLGPIHAELAESYLIGTTPSRGSRAELARQHGTPAWVITRIEDDVQDAIDILGMGFVAKILKVRGLRKKFERVRAYAEICHWEWDKIKKRIHNREEYEHDEGVDYLELEGA